MKKLKWYLIWSFVIAWILQITASMLALQGQSSLFTVILAVSMFAPLLGALFFKAPLKKIGWKPQIKGNIKYILLAWFGPAVFTILGGALYFIIFPGRFDLTGMYMKAAYGEIVISQLEAMGMTIPVYILISAIQAVTYAPWINMFFALGEEAGWRGVMQPMLKEKFGRRKGLIVGGIIWGAWHWPVMVLAGYEYGFDYFGAPVVGMVLFCLVTVVLGTLLDALYEKSKCIWVPALCHGAFNAVCSLPMLVLNPAYANESIIGPLPIGIIGIIPALLVAVLILKKADNRVNNSTNQ